MKSFKSTKIENVLIKIQILQNIDFHIFVHPEKLNNEFSRLIFSRVRHFGGDYFLRA